ncbi:DNA-binding protein [Candidatus Woesebacteria bacterium GWC2_33_12]|uniref:KilA-N DNA-binding domain-containing protein n=1 Tax=Candidatus Woesebacteria bacterium GW2011_GWB1_33_22 TaxID=1618566 RepID=A0A0G0A2B1_9BACT|nr:MAG: hypothetical protein UR29_C0002G0106 [Candidatus Woesebacteria bacterium GW2011_GWC2_33_12]KKP42578.1 MAG: hypothetical protein UR33_C0002G0154 [Candidatus Woesebacteria bacterium GW2011_GWA2_33_20]KKP45321.1 MAG: hypothetical protein UR35_C0002G0154 [Candidatus Woesebacteria bacterium GW2011_GWB1_33_22]KKP47149.1 MAG: hypothetical protein UR37_C0002G0061 [Microgenomates group bacterium GW2011_GWC1_33_28]KKP50991.1 MAG: hypothetical protein UR41_C0002G0155 [Candidatus Woesebacteria bact
MLDIRSHIYLVRGVQVMLDEDLASLYGTSTMRLNEQVKRNKSRFPQEFCFQITNIEYDNLKSQIVTSNLISQFAISKKHGGRRKLPFAFTEQGVAMLSGVLNSDIAIHISIQIMSEFVSMRKLIQVNSQLFARIDNIEQKQISDKNETDKKFNQVFDALASNKDTPKQNLFFDGQTFDAYVFVSKLIKSAKQEIILIDNFVDETVLMLLSKRKTKVTVTIYSKDVNSNLLLDLKKYNSQYPSIVIKKLNFFHDRFLITDNKSIYHFGASIKDLGKKWCAVSKLEIDTIKMLERLS